MREYSDYIVDETDWFEIPLKLLRDKYLMHTSEKHLNFLGCRNNWNLELTVWISKKSGDLSNVKVVCFNPRRLARDIHNYLNFISKFGLQKL